MGARFLTELADVLRARGLTVVEVAGWQTRARGSGGYSDPRGPVCVMWHHTASSPSSSASGDAGYIATGSPDAPLSNVMVARNGDVWVIAAGATNTNGQGGPVTLPDGTVVAANSMNAVAFGMEIQNTGVGEPYLQVCVDAAFATSLAVATITGRRPDNALGHVNWTTRKIDPATAAAVQGRWRPRSVNTSGSWSLEDLRAELNARAMPNPPRPPDPLPPEDTDMAPFIVLNTATGQPALVYGDGRLTGLAGGDLPAYTARFGEPIPTDPVVFADMASKG